MQSYQEVEVLFHQVSNLYCAHTKIQWSQDSSSPPYYISLKEAKRCVCLYPSTSSWWWWGEVDKKNALEFKAVFFLVYKKTHKTTTHNICLALWMRLKLRPRVTSCTNRVDTYGQKNKNVYEFFSRILRKMK